jgi:hypothetical protein
MPLDCTYTTLVQYSMLERVLLGSANTAGRTLQARWAPTPAKRLGTVQATAVDDAGFLPGLYMR